MVDDATGRPLRAWVPSRGFRGGSFWLDSGQPESWREYESILGKLSSDRRPRMGIGAVLAVAREAAIANQLPWEEPVCLSFYHGDVWRAHRDEPDYASLGDEGRRQEMKNNS